jgi:hypothetical protein
MSSICAAKCGNCAATTISMGVECVHGTAVHAQQRVLVRKALVLARQPQARTAAVEHVFGVGLVEYGEIHRVTQFGGVLGSSMLEKE